MSDPSYELQAALVPQIKGSSAVAAFVGNRIYDEVPKNAEFPYVSLGPVQVIPDRADCIDGTEVFVTLDIWSRKKGEPEHKLIGNAIITALDDATIAMPNFRSVSFLLESVNYLRDPDGLTNHGSLTFKGLIDATE